MSKRMGIFFTLATIVALAIGPINAQQPPPPTPPPNSTTTTSPTTTSPTTTSPTTTSPTTTSPTTTPTTTTPTTTTPTTTTNATTTTQSTTPPTTTPTTTSSTTTPPTTTATTTTSKTTTDSSSTTTGAPPAPQPAPMPKAGKWTVFDSSHNVTCIILDMAIQLNVSYPKASNETGYTIINVPSNETTANGTCGNMTQSIVLVWGSRGGKDNHTMQFVFEQNSTTKHFQLSHIFVNLSVNANEFPNVGNITVLELHNNQKEFSTTVGMSYLCSKVQKLNMTSGIMSNDTVATMKISNVQIESFHTKREDNFSASEDCEHSNSPDIVPIAVGCALVGLVTIVLIAYLVGRRRSQGSGYLSM